MDTKIQKIGTIDHVNLYYDPLRKNDSFILMKKTGEGPVGYLMIPPEVYAAQTEDVIKVEVSAKDVKTVIETSAVQTSWEEVSGILAGFKNIEIFNKIKDTLDEKNK